MTLRRLHFLSAMVIAAYACVHIVNHVVGLGGVAAHVAFMDAARSVYRLPVVEAVLLACVAFQVASGLRFVVRGWKDRRGLVPWLQAASGAYLAFFLLVHVGAVLFGRGALQLDTNFHFAAAGFHVPPYAWFFAPYYLLAVLAIFVHLGCAAHWRASSRTSRLLAVALPSSVGLVLSVLIVLSLAGALFPVDVPAAYRATYAP